MRRFAQEANVQVKLLGTVPNAELPAIINRYDCVLLVSLYEGNPKTLLEAMSCCRLAIGSNVEGIRDNIIDCKTGILCESDPESIRSAISKTVHMPPEEKMAIGRRARKYVIEKSSVAAVYRKEMAVHLSLCAWPKS